MKQNLDCIRDILLLAEEHTGSDAVDTFKRAWTSYRAYEKKHSE